MSFTIHTAIEKVVQILPYLFDRRTIKAVAAWPKFSIASYTAALSLFRSGIRPATVIDVGANIGQFAIAAANIFGNPAIYAFEPIPSCVGKLKANTSQLSNVRTFQAAVGAMNGKTRFHVNTFDQTSSLLKFNRSSRMHFRGLRPLETIWVNIVTLDTIFRNSSLHKPVLLKIDVQGGEKGVIEGARETLKRIDFVLMEMSFKPLYRGESLFSEMLDVMQSLDFAFVRPVDFFKSPRSGEMLQADILFRKNR